jgi:DnaJ-class molecular chaperone
MASDDASAEQPGAQAQMCRACRGTGRVISHLGGTPSEVVCPWCDGSGHRLSDHDAQARFRAQRA